jgi:hypothetical protein
MKYFTFLSFLILIMIFNCSCPESISFDGTERYRIAGKVTDEKGNPISNIPVSFIALLGGFHHTEVISAGISDTKGNFNLYFSKNNGTKFVLYLNSKEDYYNPNFSVDSEYNEKFIYMSLSNFSDYEFNTNEYSKLNFGVPLYITKLNNEENNYNNYVYFQTEKNAFLDSSFVDTFGFFKRPVSVNQTTSINVPQNSMVKLLFIKENKWLKDSIFVQNSPVYYTIK